MQEHVRTQIAVAVPLLDFMVAAYCCPAIWELRQNIAVLCIALLLLAGALCFPLIDTWSRVLVVTAASARVDADRFASPGPGAMEAADV